MKNKVLIAGLGGVGGYIGGKLAAYYENDADVEIIFMARGPHGKAIAEKGLTLVTSDGVMKCVPSLVTSNATEIGPVNLVICCVKNYDLENTILQLAPCVTTSTVILPIQNGLNAAEEIKKWVPRADTIEGCIYLVSRLSSPGVVTQSGNFHDLYFGSTIASNDKYGYIEDFLQRAGLPVKLVSSIQEVMWEKFFFLSPLAAITSYLDLSIGEILENIQYRNSLQQLMNELGEIAKALHIVLPVNIVEKTYSTFQAMPYVATSSLHSDFRKGSKTEVESLVGYVVQLGIQCRISTPLYKLIYDQLGNRMV